MAVLGVLFIAALIGLYIAYTNWLRRGIRPREFVSNHSAEQLRQLFTDKVAGMGWKVVDHDNPMVAQSPLLSGLRQQISLQMTREGNAIRCRIAPTRVWTKGWGQVPYKAHTLRMRLNAFERAAANGTVAFPPQPARQPMQQPMQQPVQQSAPPTPAAPPTFAPPPVASTPPVVVPAAVVAAPPVDVDDHDGRTMTREQLQAMRQATTPAAAFAPPAPVAPSMTIRLDTGAAFTVVGPTVIGRNPASPAGSAPCATQSIEDPEMSVSKTHLWLSIIDGQLMIEDLGSSNGTVIASANGAHQVVQPGQRVAVPSDASVLIGNRSFRVE